MMRFCLLDGMQKYARFGNGTIYSLLWPGHCGLSFLDIGALDHSIWIVLFERVARCEVDPLRFPKNLSALIDNFEANAATRTALLAQVEHTFVECLWGSKRLSGVRNTC